MPPRGLLPKRGGPLWGHGASTPVACASVATALAPPALAHRRRPLLAGNSRGGGARSRL